MFDGSVFCAILDNVMKFRRREYISYGYLSEKFQNDSLETIYKTQDW